jgi:uncharacterized protein
MRCSQCGVCCTETEMLLSQNDIIRLTKLGFSKKYFVRFDKRGYAFLKNMDGYCVFYDRNGHQCSIYPNRPRGCQVYPVILDEEVGIILDELCPERATISDKEKKEKGKRVMRLLQEIDNEAVERRFLTKS